MIGLVSDLDLLPNDDELIVRAMGCMEPCDELQWSLKSSLQRPGGFRLPGWIVERMLRGGVEFFRTFVLQVAEDSGPEVAHDAIVRAGLLPELEERYLLEVDGLWRAVSAKSRTGENLKTAVEARQSRLKRGLRVVRRLREGHLPPVDE